MNKYIGDSGFNHPPELELFVQNLAISSDKMPIFLPKNEIRLPIPLLLDKGSPFYIKVMEGDEERIKAYNITMESEKSLVNLTFKSIPYFLVWRFEMEPGEEVSEIDKTLRIPTDRFFIPFMSYGNKLLMVDEEETIHCYSTNFSQQDKIQVFDVSNETIAEGLFSLNYSFPHEDLHYFASPEAWNWEVRLQALIHNEADPNIVKMYHYFIIIGILATGDEYERWSNRRAFESIQRL